LEQDPKHRYGPEENREPEALVISEFEKELEGVGGREFTSIVDPEDAA
jgi:hypothetical protein